MEYGPYATQLRERFAHLQAEGLQDMKVWYRYIGSVAFGEPIPDPPPELEDMCREMVALLDAYERKEFIDISEKLK